LKEDDWEEVDWLGYKDCRCVEESSAGFFGEQSSGFDGKDRKYTP
jgi:hypothetical protein